MGKISSPEIITKDHHIEGFTSGEDSLDHWLKRKALKNLANSASRTYVVHNNYNVSGYYCMSTGSIECNKVPGKIKRNMPNPIPLMVLGRLAVDIKYQGKGIGRGLLKDAVLRTYTISQKVGVKALLVHALTDSAKHFYKRFGFIESPIEEMTLFLPMQNEIGKLLQ